MKRLILSLTLAAVALLGLSACTTAPAAAAAAPAPAIASPGMVELMLQVRAKELELERLDKMAMLKFAAESGSDLAKGFVMGQLGAKQGGASSAPSSTTQTLMAAQAQADSVALRREEMSYANSWDKRLLPYVSLGLNFAQFSRQLSFQKWSIGESNAQNRYTLDSFNRANQNAFTFGANAFGAGSAATLGGFGAAAPAAE